MESWFSSKEAKVTYTKFYESFQLPNIKAIDLLIIMGGPMNVSDDASYPWLLEEKVFIRKVMLTEVPVLGICLGAQLIANALGSRIFTNKYKEIGWFPIELVNENCELLPFPKRFPAFHWHEDTFDLPKGATCLMRSEGCENQGFIIGKNVVGLQFHLEITAEEVELMFENCENDLIDDLYVQSPSKIRELTEDYADLSNVILIDTLDYLTS